LVASCCCQGSRPSQLVCLSRKRCGAPTLGVRAAGCAVPLQAAGGQGAGAGQLPGQAAGEHMRALDHAISKICDDAGVHEAAPVASKKAR